MIQSIADAAGRHKTHGSEKKDLTTHSTKGIMSSMFSSLLPKSYWVQMDDPHEADLCHRWGNPSLGNHNIL